MGAFLPSGGPVRDGDRPMIQDSSSHPKDSRRNCTPVIWVDRPVNRYAALHASPLGVQYACGPYRKILDRHGIKASMSRKGDCYENAPMESFFSSMKTELVHRTQFRKIGRASCRERV